MRLCNERGCGILPKMRVRIESRGARGKAPKDGDVLANDDRLRLPSSRCRSVCTNRQDYFLAVYCTRNPRFAAVRPYQKGAEVKTRLGLALLAVVIVIIALQVYLASSKRPAIPSNLYQLFPADVKFGIFVNVPALLPLLPSAAVEKLPERGRALASSSTIYIGCSEDIEDIYLILEGSPPLKEIAELLGLEKPRKSSVAGFSAISFEGGCAAMVQPTTLYAVFAENGAKKLADALSTTETKLDKNIAKTLSEATPDSLIRICGFPGNNTPQLIPGDEAFMLQMQARIFSLMLYSKPEKTIFARLNLYFNEAGARDLMAISLPRMLESYAKSYPVLAPLIRNIQYFPQGKNNNLRMELSFPAGIIEAFLNPPPAPSPLIPHIPEFPR